MLIFFTSRYYYFFEKFKIVEKQQCKLNCSHGKVSHTLNRLYHKSNLVYPGNSAIFNFSNKL